jgi:hypothetical protein
MESFISGHSIIILIILGIISFIVYFVPSIIAYVRGHLNFVPIFLVNLLLGWVLIGWVAALIWSFTSHTRKR